MSKWTKGLIAVLLLPLCIGATKALVRVLRATGSAETIWVALLSGAACWIVIYLLLPRPMWIYVFGHELTHALWTWIFGGQVKRLKATSSGGHVVVTTSNFVIALAPYFFPIYVVIVVVVFELGNWIWGWTGYLVYFHLLIGAAYAFHVTLTWQVLKSRQPDVTSHGFFFSGAVIWLANLVILLLGLALLTSKVHILTALALNSARGGHLKPRQSCRPATQFWSRDFNSASWPSHSFVTEKCFKVFTNREWA